MCCFSVTKDFADSPLLSNTCCSFLVNLYQIVFHQICQHVVLHINQFSCLCGTQAAGGVIKPEKEQEKDKCELHRPAPVVSTSVFLPEICSTNEQKMKRIPASLKRKRLPAADGEINPGDAVNGLRDEDEMFLLSLLPWLKRLTLKKRMEVRMKFQQVLYAAEFED